MSGIGDTDLSGEIHLPGVVVPFIRTDGRGNSSLDCRPRIVTLCSGHLRHIDQPTFSILIEANEELYAHSPDYQILLCSFALVLSQLSQVYRSQLWS